MIPIAPNGIFWTINGEGIFAGRQMAFVRLAGCSVGCRLCDTDYSVAERLSVAAVIDRAKAVIPPDASEPIAWITGGEPTDHAELPELISAFRDAGILVALATAGTRPLTMAVDFVSVSPHDPANWQVRYGNELKLVPGLNGFGLSDFEPIIPSVSFKYKWIQPCAGLDNLDECKAFLARNPDWRLSVQVHKIIGVP